MSNDDPRLGMLADALEAAYRAGRANSNEEVSARDLLTRLDGAATTVADILDELHDILREAVDELPELAVEEQGARQHWEGSVGAYPADPLSSSRTVLADRCAAAATKLRTVLPPSERCPDCNGVGELPFYNGHVDGKATFRRQPCKSCTPAVSA